MVIRELRRRFRNGKEQVGFADGRGGIVTILEMSTKRRADLVPCKHVHKQVTDGEHACQCLDGLY